MPTLTINMVTCLKNIRKAWNKKQLAVQHGDYSGSYSKFLFLSCYQCAIGIALNLGEFSSENYTIALAIARHSSYDHIYNMVPHKRLKLDPICDDLKTLEDAHCGGPVTFHRCLVRMEKKYGVR